ncbi:aldo/keto reductase [Diaphorobacter sp. HDW4A]|uniref:aldo/keto reductase n=1 Tax=Diaphorobacter sp. HDW4A TaxID=2714924 RepID=UPI00140E72D5|nr:aldo/keto reductase [Diaphorobacter sp. HDW4A]QIL80620.1 aldo/keto reductase [Diaphorobacter sp. HDW4A]
METRTLGSHGLNVSAVGLGCMGMSFAYGGADESEALGTLHRALELGCNFWDTAEVYGPYTNEQLLAKALKGRRDQVIVATKFGFDIAPETPERQGAARMVGLDSRPEHIREVVHASLARLEIEAIDLLYQHRVDPAVSIEEVVGVMSDLVREGKVRFLGLSEPSAATLKRAHAVHPISAVQSEYSLWSREVEETTLPTCAQLGVGFVSYSPLGRGALTGKLPAPDQLAPDDFRRHLPRFQADAWERNAGLIATLERMAGERGCTAAQLALAWVLAQGEHIVSIPGARREPHLRENIAAADIRLSVGDLAEISASQDPGKVRGERYTAASLALVNR